jgi:hypothetical protein
VKTRSLKIAADLWIGILMYQKPQVFRVIKNALPEDAKCVGLEFDPLANVVTIKISSTVFQDSDPDELPPVQFETFPKGQ